MSPILLFLKMRESRLAELLVPHPGRAPKEALTEKQERQIEEQVSNIQVATWTEVDDALIFGEFQDGGHTALLLERFLESQRIERAALGNGTLSHVLRMNSEREAVFRENGLENLYVSVGDDLTIKSRDVHTKTYKRIQRYYAIERLEVMNMSMRKMRTWNQKFVLSAVLSQYMGINIVDISQKTGISEEKIARLIKEINPALIYESGMKIHLRHGFAVLDSCSDDSLTLVESPETRANFIERDEVFAEIENELPDRFATGVPHIIDEKEDAVQAESKTGKYSCLYESDLYIVNKEDPDYEVFRNILTARPEHAIVRVGNPGGPPSKVPRNILEEK